MKEIIKGIRLTGYLLLFSLIVPGRTQGQRHFDFNTGCRKAYGEIIRLRLDDGQHLLDLEKKKDPDNLIPYFLENYIDFFVLFFNGDPAEYKIRKDHLESRLAMMSEGPESSPFFLFSRSVIHFQWAAVKIKFGSNWDAGWDFRRSFIEAKDNQRLFPGFSPAFMLSSAMQVVAGTIPEGYKWLSNLLGIKGNIGTGMQGLSGFVSGTDPWADLYHNEAIFYYLYLKFYIENKQSEVFAFIQQHKLDVRNNHLFAYLACNLAVNDQQALYAQQIIRQRSKEPGYLDLPVWDLEMGYARLNHLDTDANVYLERYVSRFRGSFYIKDALQKISWFYYLNNNDLKAGQFRARILKEGGAISDADKQALKEAKAGGWADKRLLKARLLCDGGYYQEALLGLEGVQMDNFGIIQDRVEFTYRLGRIYDGLGRVDEAIAAYESAFDEGKGLTAYYAAKAALQTGYLYEKKSDPVRALDWFRKCISLKDHEYKNSLDQKAKAGIERNGR